MSNKFLAGFLSDAPLPSPLVPFVLRTYKATFPLELASNPSLDASATTLVTKTTSADVAIALIKSGNVHALRALLATSETRNSVIAAIDKYWRLPAPEQLLLVDRKLSDSSCDLLFSQDHYTDATKAHLLAKGPKRDALSWMYAAALDDNSLFVLIETLLPTPHATYDSFVPILIARPGLRSRALHSDFDLLFRDACWTDLEESDQEYATERALHEMGAHTPTYGAAVRGRSAHAAIGVLAQPSLRHDLRARLYEAIVEKGFLSAALISGVRPPQSPFNVGRPLRSLSSSELSAVLDAISCPSNDSFVRDAQVSALVGIWRNKNLTLDQQLRVVIGLDQHIGASLHHRSSHIVSAFHSAVSRLKRQSDDANKPFIYKTSYAAQYVIEKSHYDYDPPTAPLATRDLSELVYKGTPYHQTELADVLNATPLAISNWTAAYRFLTPHLAILFGPGDTEGSTELWRAFLTLVASDPDIPIKDIITTAGSMARANALVSY